MRQASKRFGIAWAEAVKLIIVPRLEEATRQLEELTAKLAEEAE